MPVLVALGIGGDLVLRELNQGLKRFKGCRGRSVFTFFPKLELPFGLLDKNNCHYQILAFLCPQLFVPENSFRAFPVRWLEMKNVKFRFRLPFSDSSSGNIFNNKRLLNIYYVAGTVPLYKYFSLNPPDSRWEHASDDSREVSRGVWSHSVWSHSQVHRVGCGV